MGDSIYREWERDRIDELLSNYLISSWSYSKVAAFARNEKDFERRYIYNEVGKSSASTVAGQAYHSALELFFKRLRDGGEQMTLAELQQEAYEYIDSFPPAQWKKQKTTPTIDDCKVVASKYATALLQNFVAEISTYLDEVSEVIGVELRCSEWLTINGVDIPMPCVGIIDLVVRTEEGRVVIIDHKSKAVYTDDKDIALSRGKQAITYVALLESSKGITADEVIFIENKYSKNKDGSAQLRRFAIPIDRDTRRLYEVMLYEPLRRMVQAVGDPDYVFTINDNDTLTDKAELYDFWLKTLTAEVDDFVVAPEKRDLIAKRQKKIRDASLAAVSPKVIKSFRKNAQAFITFDYNLTDMNNKERIEHILRTFGYIVSVAHEIEGYSSTTYLLEMSAGMQISNVNKYRLDIASALNVSSVRIGEKLTVYNGRSYLAVEVPHKRTRDLLFDPARLCERKIPIGEDNFGNTIIWDINSHSTPHMLICGATGSGKSVSIISTIEYARLAGVERIIIFDPKCEFSRFKDIGCEIYDDISSIESKMEKLVAEMQNRVKSGKNSLTLIIFDEFADAVQSARTGKSLDIREEVQVGTYASGLPKMKTIVVGRHRSLEENLRMLLQKGRSLGYRVVAATQRASTKIITGDAKVNFPVQICFRVPKEIDSKVVLDTAGAESLAGLGDGLMRSPEYDDVVRFQGFYMP